jgi:guanylate kinase
MSGQLFIISGPSGVGKSTIVAALGKSIDGLGYSVSHTSRSPRGSEVDGTDYHFVDKETFEGLIEAGAFVEWAEVYHDYYGTSFAAVNKQIASGVDVLLDVDPQGARNIKDHFENSVLIYILPPSLDVLEGRLKARGTDEESALKTRLENAAREIKECTWYDYIIINSDLDKAVGEVQAVVTAERCRSARREQTVKNIFAKYIS